LFYSGGKAIWAFKTMFLMEVEVPASIMPIRLNDNDLDLVMIVTCINDNYIIQMMESVIINNHYITVLILFINQSSLAFDFKNSNSRVFIKEIKSKKTSLSNSRNAGIDYLLNNSIKFQHIMFPDDDSTFSESFFQRYKNQINDKTNYLIDVYCEGTEKLFKNNNYKNGEVLSHHNYDAAISVNMIVNYNTFINVGFFDERIGVGAKYGAGEDADYYLRACGVAPQAFIYNKNIFNFHPSTADKFSNMKLFQTIDKYVSYGNGAIFMFCKHKMYIEALKTCFRAIAGALLSILRADFKLLIAYLIAFFSRSIMFVKCIAFSHQLYKNEKTIFKI
jgi:hypothetical protein